MTSCAWISGESSSPNAAWIPPCALAELHACTVVFVARPTRTPARSAATAAANPEAPLPITSTSKEGRVGTGRMVAQVLIAVITDVYSRCSLRDATGYTRPFNEHTGRDRQADLHRGRPGGHARGGRRADASPERRGRRREGFRPAYRDPDRAGHASGDGCAGAHERGARTTVDDARPDHSAARSPTRRRGADDARQRFPPPASGRRVDRARDREPPTRARWASPARSRSSLGSAQAHADTTPLTRADAAALTLTARLRNCAMSFGLERIWRRV